MNGTDRNFVRWGALGFVVLAVTAVMTGWAAATPVTGVGDVLKSVDMPTAALCGGTGGTAAAVIPGGKLGFPKIRVLLVTSCIDAGVAKLFFLDPSTSPATLVQQITTLVNPAGGWRALALRADQGDLLACALDPVTGATSIYSIDFSPFNTVIDGTTSLLLTGPPLSSCNGISWDVSNVSSNGTPQPAAIYLSPSAGTDVFRIAMTTPPATLTIPSGCAGSVTAMGVAGRSLFVACPPPTGSSVALIRQLNKDPAANGALVRSFNGVTSSPGGLTADPVSFGSEFKDVLWSKDNKPTPPRLAAAYIPGGTIGQALGAPVAFPAACPSTYPTQADGTTLDSDGDGLLDCWEDGSLWSDGYPGISFTGNWTGNPANRDLTLCVDVNANGSFGVPGSVEFQTECASKNHKDLFVEIDWMENAVLGISHNPDVSAPNAIPNIVAAFAAAQPVSNPDGVAGIRLHVQRSEPIPHFDRTALTPCTPAQGTGDANFDALKAQYFGNPSERTAVNAINILNAKAFVYRYGLFVHNQSGTLNTSTGCAEIGGNDFMVSLGSWGPFNFGTSKKPNYHNVGTADQQAGTIMHEFGHTLNLRHGGGDNINCKPNYFSVMNYSLQFSSPVNPRPLDYSRQALITLDKSHLNESSGVGGLSGQKVVYGPVLSGASVNVSVADSSIDWNDNGVIDANSNFSLDINQTTDATGGCPASQGAILEGFNDWVSIQYNVLASFDQAAGAKASHEPKKGGGNIEIQLSEALEFSLDRIDFKPADPNNSYSSNSAQTVSVAIFGRGGDAPLDATDIDPSTLTLRGINDLTGFTWAVPVNQNTQGTFQCKVQDVDKDGLPDLVCPFSIPKNTIFTGQTSVVIDGATSTGQPVHSSDFINVN